MSVNLGQLIRVKNIIGDLGIFLDEKELAERTTAHLLGMNNLNMDSFRELHSSVLLASAAYNTAIDLSEASRLDDFQLDMEDGSYDQLACQYVVLASLSKRDLFSVCTGVLMPFIKTGRPSLRTYGLIAEDLNRIEKLLEEKTILAMTGAVRILESAKKRKFTAVVQRNIYSLNAVIEKLNGNWMRFRVEMFEDLGFKEAFVFLCQKALSA